MNKQTLNTFYHAMKQSSENHKPYRHRKSHSKDPEILAAMKIKMALRKEQNKHKRDIAKARLARDNYKQLDTINVGDATIADLVDDYAILEESRRQDMEEEY